MANLEVYVYDSVTQAALQGFTCGVLNAGGTPVGYGTTNLIGKVDWNGLNPGDDLTLIDGTYTIIVYGGANYRDNQRTKYLMGVMTETFYLQPYEYYFGGPTHITYEVSPPIGQPAPNNQVNIVGHLLNEDNDPVLYPSGYGLPYVTLFQDGVEYAISSVQPDGSFGWYLVGINPDLTHEFTIEYAGHTGIGWEPSEITFLAAWTPEKENVTITIYSEPTEAPAGTTFHIKGVLAEADTGLGLYGTVKLYRDGAATPVASQTTQTGGLYDFSQILTQVKNYTFQVGFDGNTLYNPNTSPTITVKVGPLQQNVTITYQADSGTIIYRGGVQKAPPSSSEVFQIGSLISLQAEVLDNYVFDGWYSIYAGQSEYLGNSLSLERTVYTSETIRATAHLEGDDVIDHTYREIDVYKAVPEGYFYFYWEGKRVGNFSTTEAADAKIDSLYEGGGEMDYTMLLAAGILGLAYLLGQERSSRRKNDG